MRGRSGQGGNFRTLAALALALAVVLVVPACSGLSGGTGEGGADVAAGTLVADSGFRPDDHGFAFENYGEHLPDGSVATNLTPDDVRTMFGDGVCRDAAAKAHCDLIPEAEEWLEETNAEMSLGHCYGLAVASSLLWKRTLTPSSFGALEPSSLDIDGNQSLQRRIAYDWAAQLLDSVRQNVVFDSPNEVLDVLQKSLEPSPDETYTIVLWKPDGTGGHAVTPFAVEALDDQKYGVLIYDNNWPGETRVMTFDRKANSWSYDAAINPDAPEEIYKGNAKTKNVALFPASPGIGVQPCPFCGRRNAAGATGPRGNAGSAARPTEEIFLRSGGGEHADLLITDESGRRVGFVDGELVQEIPGARVDRLLFGDDARVESEPHFVVPADERYTITLDAGRLGHDGVETLGVVGPSFDASARDIHVRHGDRNVLTVDISGEAITYATSRAQTPVIRVGISEEDASYRFDVRGLSEQPGTKIHLRLPVDAGVLFVEDEGSGVTSKVHLRMQRYDEVGVQVFEAPMIPLPGDATAELHFGDFTGAEKDQVPLVVKRNGHMTATLLHNDAIPSRS